jgi:membrane-associated phospholipid phosphatase
MTSPAVQRRMSRAWVSVAVLLALFVVTDLAAYRARSGTALDHAVLNAVVGSRTPGLTTLAVVITTVFSPVGTGAMAVIAATVLWWRLRSPRPTILVLLALSAAGGASSATKYLVGAHRPAATMQLVGERSPSFPSGHVTGTVALVGVLTVIVGCHTHVVRRWTMAVAGAIIAAAVAWSRLYLGVHWLTDVVGAALLGALVTVLAHLAYRQVLRRPANPGSTIPQPTDLGSQVTR